MKKLSIIICLLTGFAFASFAQGPGQFPTSFSGTSGYKFTAPAFDLVSKTAFKFDFAYQVIDGQIRNLTIQMQPGYDISSLQYDDNGIMVTGFVKGTWAYYDPFLNDDNESTIPYTGNLPDESHQLTSSSVTVPFSVYIRSVDLVPNSYPFNY